MEENKQEPHQEEQYQHLSKHERRELKRLKKEEEKTKIDEIRKKKKLTKNIITYSIIAVIAIGFIYLIYFLVTKAPSNDNTLYDLSGIPSGEIHTHSWMRAFICGERKDLPEPLPGGEIGTGLSHVHDRATNKDSMPSSDGNGVMHLEGNVKTNPGISTLMVFMRNIGVEFSETDVMDKKNGDLCDGKTGNVNVYVNDKKYESDINYYIPKDGDIIDIKFE